MFDLEQSIAEWRAQLLGAGIKTPGQLDELENHLREELARKTRPELDESVAFNLAAGELGWAEIIGPEFKKIEAGDWNHQLAWAAWTLFVAAFFLPASGLWWGWKCAVIAAAAVTWPEFWHGNWGTIYLASMTLANLVMIASPFLLPRLSRSVRGVTWLRLATFAALTLVWSYVLLLLAAGGGGIDLKYGCYIWAISFLLLSLATVKIRNPKKLATQYV